jgi:hypothetical protein
MVEVSTLDQILDLEWIIVIENVVLSWKRLYSVSLWEEESQCRRTEAKEQEAPPIDVISALNFFIQTHPCFLLRRPVKSRFPIIHCINLYSVKMNLVQVGGTPRSTSLKKTINRLTKIIVGPKIKSIAQTVITIYFNFVKFLS